jgi:hypothetical protein
LAFFFHFITRLHLVQRSVMRGALPPLPQYVSMARWTTLHWNPKVHHLVHKSPLLDPIMSQPIPVRPIDHYLNISDFSNSLSVI